VANASPKERSRGTILWLYRLTALPWPPWHDLSSSLRKRKPDTRYGVAADLVSQPAVSVWSQPPHMGTPKIPHLSLVLMLSWWCATEKCRPLWVNSALTDRSYVVLARLIPPWKRFVARTTNGGKGRAKAVASCKNSPPPISLAASLVLLPVAVFRQFRAISSGYFCTPSADVDGRLWH